MSRAAKPVEPIIPVVSADEIPSDWELKRIGDITDAVSKVNPKDEPHKAIEYIDISGVDNAAFRIGNTKTFVGRDAPSRARQLVRAGDIVFSTVRTYLKNLALVPSELDGQIASTGFCVLRASDPAYSKYLFYFVQFDRFLNQLSKHQRGTSYPAVRDGDVKAQFIPIPPPAQANLIVSEIEKQFSRLDEAVTNLKRVKANLKRYKAAVLKAAVEGKLTEEWRKQNPGVEPASKLLERILAERPKVWQEMVTICNRPAKYAEPVAVDAKQLPELPPNWVWAAADQISDFITKGTTPNTSKLTAGDGDIQFLKVYNLTFDGALNSSYKPAFVSQMTHDKNLARSKVFAGDVLINIVGPPLGQVSVVPLELKEANINQAIARFRPVAPMSPAYLAMALRASSVMARAIARAKTTAGQSNLTLAICRELPIPLPSAAEQVEIMAETDRLLSSSAGIEKDVDGAFKRAAKLRQAVLNDAFSGQLNGLSS